MKLIRIGVGPHPSPQQCRSAFPKSCSVVWLGFVQWWWLGEQRKGRLHAHEMFKTDSLEAKAGIRGLAGWSVSSTVLCLLWAPPQLSSVPLLMSPHVSAPLKCIFWTLKKWAFGWTLQLLTWCQWVWPAKAHQGPHSLFGWDFQGLYTLCPGKDRP